MGGYFAAFGALTAAVLPALHAHLARERITPDLYLPEWVLTLFAKSLPLDSAMRVWDVFFLLGDRAVFCAGLACLHATQARLAAMPFEDLFGCIKTLAGTVPAADLVAAIAAMDRAVTPARYAAALCAAGLEPA